MFYAKKSNHNLFSFFDENRSVDKFTFVHQGFLFCKWSLISLNYTKFGSLQVLKVHCKGRTDDMDFITTVKLAIHAKYKDQPIGK